MNGIIQHLIKHKKLDADLAQDILKQQKQTGSSIAELLDDNDISNAKTTASLTASVYGFPLVDANAINPDFIPGESVSQTLTEKHKVFPIFKRGSRIMLATVDPTNQQALNDIRFATNSITEYVVVDYAQLNDLKNASGSSSDSLDDFDDFDDAGLDSLEVQDDPTEDNTVNLQGAEEAPIVKYVNKLLVDAIRLGSSDLHFEPYEKMFRVRFRTDGILQEAARPPINLAARIAARLKIMAKLDTSERRVPQDGRIKLKISKNRAIDFRVSTCPTIWGEKIVMRILDPESAKMGIDALGYEDAQKQLYLEALKRPQGMILITGPTGSGKTVSLYTGINILNEPERNISTAEDPVEINLPGINQVNINLKQGLDFPKVLRSFLRQDPDIILVGEIRDLETAGIAIKAAQTGHLVLSTLHTNSASETLTRLRNMGVPSFNIATSVKLIIAQRLARRLCSSCKVPLDTPKEALLEMGFSEEQTEQKFTVYEPKGCSKCNKGYKGRTGIYEVVQINEEIMDMILQDKNSLELARKFSSLGFNSLRISGLNKVIAGTTSIEEVDRVTSD